MTRRLTIALILILTVAGVSAAQLSVVPSVQYQVSELKGIDPDGTTFVSTDHKGLRFGVDVDFGNGIRAAATYISIGGDTIVDEYGDEFTLDTNRVSDLRLAVMYLVEFDQFAVGPVLDYTRWSWEVKDAFGESTESTGSLGLGVHASADFDTVRVGLSYIHRFNETLTSKYGTATDTFEGTGNRLTIDIAVPVASPLTIVAGYDVVTHIETGDGRYKSSGWRLGASYAF